MLQALETRAQLYALLQRLYTHPLSGDVLEVVAALEVEGQEEATASSSLLRKGLQRMKARLEAAADWEQLLEALNIERTRLFEGPGQTPAPPYASFYLNGGRLMGEETQRVRRFYLECHVVPDCGPEGGRLPDDHLALELGFMAYLAQMASRALEEDDDAGLAEALEFSRRFLTDHLTPWVPRFCTELYRASQDPFFQGLAQLTAGYLDEDSTWLKGMGVSPTTLRAFPD